MLAVYDQETDKVRVQQPVNTGVIAPVTRVSEPSNLEGWNGTKPFATNRIGRGSITIPRLCLSFFGGIQPGKLHLRFHLIGTDGCTVLNLRTVKPRS